MIVSKVTAIVVPQKLKVKLINYKKIPKGKIINIHWVQKISLFITNGQKMLHNKFLRFFGLGQDRQQHPAVHVTCETLPLTHDT